MSGKGMEGARSVWFGCHCFFMFSGFPFRYPPSLFYISIFPSVSFLGTGLLWPLEVRWFGENIGASIVAKSWQIAERPPKDWRRCGSYVCERSAWAGISSIFTSIFFSCASKEPAREGVRKGKKHLVVICFGMFCPVSGLVAATYPGILVNFEFWKTLAAGVKNWAAQSFC